ncbi:MAG: hypothetical protein WC865_07670 [Bacteroidales bacterium]
MKPNILLYIVLQLLLCGCNGGNVRNVNSEDKSVLVLDQLIGCQFDTILLCTSSLSSASSLEKLVLNPTKAHSLILYFGEGMCGACVQDAIKFVKEELKFLPSSQIKIVTRYTNVRAPAVIFKMNDCQYRFCNISDIPLQLANLGLDKPLFLLIDKGGKIINLFQLRDELKSRMRASIEILAH